MTTFEEYQRQLAVLDARRDALLSQAFGNKSCSAYAITRIPTNGCIYDMSVPVTEQLIEHLVAMDIQGEHAFRFTKLAPGHNAIDVITYFGVPEEVNYSCYRVRSTMSSDHGNGVYLGVLKNLHCGYVLSRQPMRNITFGN